MEHYRLFIQFYIVSNRCTYREQNAPWQIVQKSRNATRVVPLYCFGAQNAYLDVRYEFRIQIGESIEFGLVKVHHE